MTFSRYHATPSLAHQLHYELSCGPSGSGSGSAANCVSPNGGHRLARAVRMRLASRTRMPHITAFAFTPQIMARSVAFLACGSATSCASDSTSASASGSTSTAPWLCRPCHSSNTCKVASASNRWATLQFLRHPSTTRSRAWSSAVCPAVSHTSGSAPRASSSRITGTWHLTYSRGLRQHNCGKFGARGSGVAVGCWRHDRNSLQSCSHERSPARSCLCV